MLIRQTMGGKLSNFDVFLMVAFVSIGCVVAVDAMLPPLLSIFDLPSGVLWATASGLAAVILASWIVIMVALRRQGLVGADAALGGGRVRVGHRVVRGARTGELRNPARVCGQGTARSTPWPQGRERRSAPERSNVRPAAQSEPWIDQRALPGGRVQCPPASVAALPTVVANPSASGWTPTGSALAEASDNSGSFLAHLGFMPSLTRSNNLLAPDHKTCLSDK